MPGRVGTSRVAMESVAREFCRGAQIVVSGGFNLERVARFEREGAAGR